MEPTHFESLYLDTARFKEIEKILKFIKEGNSVQLLGLPGAGKSNVFGLLAYNRGVRLKHLGENQKWFHFVPLNFSEIRKRPLADAWKFIFLGLIESLNERKKPVEYEAVNKIFKEIGALDDEMVLFQGLKRAIDYLSIEKELTVVLLFDRIEEYAQMLDSSFFANLRVLRNRAKYRFSAVFSTTRPLEDIVEPSILADFYEFVVGHDVYLELMDKTGLDFRISYIEKVSGKKIDNKLKEEVISLTGGHGKLTRLCLEATIAQNYELRIKNKELKQFLLEQKTIQGALSEIWNFLIPSEQKSLITIPLVASGYLTDIGLAKDGEITIPLFENYVSTIEQSSNLTISFDSSTNEIKKGGNIISEQLSRAEYRLLRFLIENKEKIVEKDEIIQAVWKESKTQEGVTDQALDQIVYRLRKKIEDDPNNPRHIQTIKGRGLKFTP